MKKGQLVGLAQKRERVQPIADLALSVARTLPLFILCLALTLPARAADPVSRLQAAMTLYAWGIPIGTMDLDGALQGETYRAVSHLHTSGLVSVFWKADISATSAGKRDGRTLRPSVYDSFDIGRSGKKQQVSLRYDGDAPPRLIADPPYSTTGFEVKPQDSRSTLDPLSAVMLIASGAAADATNPCGFTAPVFDGRRRYDIVMAKVRDLDITLDLYQGAGVECDIRYRQIAGFRPRVIKDRESFPLIHAWIARFPNPATGQDYTVPLRVWADTGYGRLTVLADTLQIDSAVPKSVRLKSP